MVSITAFSIHNTRFVLLTVLLSAVMGILIFTQYPSKEDPSIVIRSAQITAHFQGMTPERIEELVTTPIEKKLREIPEIDIIVSDSKTGVSLVKIKVHDNVTDLDAVWQDVRNKMADVSHALPQGTVGPMVNDEVGLTVIASIALWSDDFSYAEMEAHAERLRGEFYALKGTQKVTLYGIQEEQIFIEFSAAKLAQLGVDPSVIISTLKSQNIILPGGKINTGDLDIVLEPSGNLLSLDEIKSLLIAIPNTDKLMRLGDITTISRGYVDPPKAPIYFNAKPAIILALSVQNRVNSIDYGKRLKRRVAQLQSELPWGVVLDFATFQPELVDKSVSGAINNLYQTIAIVLLVVVAFLGFRSGLIVGSFVPVTMLTAVVLMSLFDVELQRMSIAAMIISLGMLVDNGIVMVESINVKVAKGMDRASAAISAGKMLAIPLLTSTLTTILFFVPIAMAEGGVGEYTMSLAQVITIVLLVSWFLSLYITPVISAKFLPIGGVIDPEQGYFSKRYEWLLHRLLRFKIVFIMLMVVLLVGSGYSLTKVGKEFFPLGDRNQFLIYIDLPAGTSITKTDEVMQRLSQWLSDDEINAEVESSVSYVASGGPRFFLSLSPPDPDPHRGFTVVNTQSSNQVDVVINRVKLHLLARFPAVRADVKKMWMGASEAGLFELRIKSADLQELFGESEKIIKALHAIPNMSVVKQDWENKVIKLEVNIDQARARAVGISSEQVANALNSYLDGGVITDYREGDNIIPIIVRGLEAERTVLSGISNLNVYSKMHNKMIPLGQVADVEGHWQVGRIKRRNQQRTLTISARHNSLTAAQILNEIQPLLDGMSGNFEIEVAGEIEEQSKANGKLFANFPYAIGLIILLLVWQFNSYRKTAIILMTIPLVLVGATLGLVVMDALFGFMVILGFFSLAGIIINNGIVLIDQIAEEESKEGDRYQALVTACLSRLRPIMVTTLTTVLGLMPLILSNDALFYGMASAMAFGLAVGSMMTLGFVPALYALFYSVHAIGDGK